MKKILLDIDGVIADFYSGFSKFLNQNYGTKLPAEEPHYYDFNEWGGGIDKINIDNATIQWIAENGYLKLKPYAGAKEFVQSLSNDFDVYIVTARVGEFTGFHTDQIKRLIKQETIQWLSDFIVDTNKVYFEYNKIDFCHRHNILCMIEDKLATAIRGSKHGISTVLVNRNWNQKPDSDLIKRAYSYNEVLFWAKKFAGRGD